MLDLLLALSYYSRSIFKDALLGSIDSCCWIMVGGTIFLTNLLFSSTKDSSWDNIIKFFIKSRFLSSTVKRSIIDFCGSMKINFSARFVLFSDARITSLLHLLLRTERVFAWIPQVFSSFLSAAFFFSGYVWQVRVTGKSIRRRARVYR